LRRVEREWVWRWCIESKNNVKKSTKPPNNSTLLAMLANEDTLDSLQCVENSKNFQSRKRRPQHHFSKFCNLSLSTALSVFQRREGLP
jgi:hypothetical protein